MFKKKKNLSIWIGWVTFKHEVAGSLKNLWNFSGMISVCKNHIDSSVLYRVFLCVCSVEIFFRNNQLKLYLTVFGYYTEFREVGWNLRLVGVFLLFVFLGGGSVAFADCSLRITHLVSIVLAHLNLPFPLGLCVPLSASTDILLTISNQAIPKTSTSKLHPHNYLLICS